MKIVKLGKNIFVLLSFCTVTVLIMIQYMTKMNRNMDIQCTKEDNSEFDHAYIDRKSMSTFVADPFIPDNGDCSVSVISTEDELKKYVTDDPKQAPICTMNYFKDYMYKNKRLVGKGRFFAPPEGSLSNKTVFHPDGCTFSDKLKNLESLRTCFKKKSIKSMLMTGDSNSVVLRQQFDNYITELNGGEKSKRIISCRYGLNETTFDYFKVEDMDNRTLLVQGEPCQKSRCTLLEGVTFMLERISIIHVLDASVHIENPTHTPEGRFLHTPTKLEYMLKYFYPEKGFPDFWLFMLPFHHECLSNSVTEMRADLDYMMDLFNIFLPSTSNVVILTDTRSCPDKDVPKIKAEMDKRNLKYNQCIHDMNQLMVEVLLERDLPDNIHVFLDMGQLTCPVVCQWHKDGQHMIHEWYKFMFMFMLESYCQDTQ